VTKSCFLCGKKLGFWADTFGKYTLSQEECSIPKGFGDEDVICLDCLESQQKLVEQKRKESQQKLVEQKRKESKPKREESKPNKKLDMSEKPSAAWYLAPIFLEIIGSAIMWFVLKDEDHPDAPKMVEKGWIIGIALTLITIVLVLINIALIPFAFSGL